MYTYIIIINIIIIAICVGELFKSKLQNYNFPDVSPMNKAIDLRNHRIITKYSKFNFDNKLPFNVQSIFKLHQLFQ